MATPCCAKCGHTSFTYSTKTHGGITGMYVYCAGCGAVVSWVPKPQ